MRAQVSPPARIPDGPSPALWPVLVLIGLTAVIAQIVLMRELIVVCYGNEVSLGLVLANWLLWTAVGSGVLGRLTLSIRSPRRAMAALEVLVAGAFPATILFVRAAREHFQSVPGELLGPGSMFLISFLTLSLFCALSGWLFAAASRLYTEQRRTSTAEATGSVYWLEGAGAGAGGMVTGLFLVSHLSALEIALLVALLNLAAAVHLALPARPRLRTAVLALLGLSVFLTPPAARRMESASLARLWRGFRLVETRNSPYGNLALVRTGGTSTVFENGLVLFNVPDPAAAEEAVHYALLQHPAPASLLLIGGGAGGSLAEALRHTSLIRVDYVELDPAVISLVRERFQREWNPLERDPRVHIYNTDGRLFLKTSPSRYDVIIVNLPDPQTAQINRFYTLEFFREVASRLAPSGVFSFHLTGAEDYISPELARFLRCINKTLRMVFSQVAAIPGEPIHFFAAKQPGVLAGSTEALLARLRSRGIKTTYVRDYYIPFRMTPDRMLDLETQIQPRPDTPVNKDFAPVAYYFDAALWAARFHPGTGGFFQTLSRLRFGYLLGGTGLLVFILVLVLRFLAERNLRPRASAGFAVAVMGFTLIGLEVLILLGFQAIYGSVYHQLAVVTACFMLGIALGSWRAVRKMAGVSDAVLGRILRSLAALQLAAALSGLILFILFDLFARVENPGGLFVVSQVLFPLLALLSGLLGGWQFPIAARVFFAGGTSGSGSPGTLYALDLAGAFAGALLFSAWLIPVFGLLKTAVLMAVVNLAPASLALLTARSSAGSSSLEG